MKKGICQICGRELPMDQLGEVDYHPEYDGDDYPILVCFECN